MTDDIKKRTEEISKIKDGLNAHLEEMIVKRNNLKLEIEGLSDALEKSKTSLNEIEFNKNIIEEEVQKLRREGEDLSLKLPNMQQDLNSKKDEVDRLSDVLNEIKKEKDEKHHELNNLVSQIESSMQSLSGAEKNLEDTRNELEKITTSLKGKQEEYRLLQDEVKKNLETRRQYLEEANLAKENQLTILEESQALKEEISRSKIEFNEINNEINNRRNELEEKIISCGNLSTQLAEMEKEIDQQKSLQNDVAEKMKDFENKKIIVEHEINDKELLLEKKNQELIKCSENKKKLIENIDCIKNKLVELNDEEKTRKEILATFGEELALKEEQRKLLSIEIDALNEVKNNLKEDTVFLQNDLSEMGKQYEELTEQVVKSENEEKKVSALLDEKKKQAEDYDRTYKSLKDNIHNLELSKVQIENAVRILQNDYDIKTEEFNSFETEIKNFQLEKDKHINEINMLTEQKTQMDRSVDEYTDSLARLKEEQSNLEKIRQIFENQNKEIERDLESKFLEFTNLKDKCSELEMKKGSLSKDIESLKQRKEYLDLNLDGRLHGRKEQIASKFLGVVKDYLDLSGLDDEEKQIFPEAIKQKIIEAIDHIAQEDMAMYKKGFVRKMIQRVNIMLKKRRTPVERRVQIFWAKVGGGAIAVAVLVFFIVYAKPFSKIQQYYENQTKADLQSEKMIADMQKRIPLQQKEIFIPPKTFDIKNSYTDNILYTNGFTEKTQNTDLLNKRRIQLDQYIVDLLDLPDHLTVKFLVAEMELVKKLNKISQELTVDHKDEEIARMRLAEKNFVDDFSKAVDDNSKAEKILRYNFTLIK